MGVALSVKQPWAALLATGYKTIEVRTWSTARRGSVFLHAAKVPDPRPHGWTFVTSDDLRELAKTGGGIIAVAELVDCITYEDATSFLADTVHHRNLATWFRPPKLFGFVFANVRPVPFHRVPGNTGFFPVRVPTRAETPPPTETEVAESPSPQETPALPPPPAPVIIIDPPEGKEAEHHD